MEQKLTSEQIRQRLDELRILKNEEKNKLESLLNQKKSEIKENISADIREDIKEDIKEELTEEEKKLMEVFKDKSVEEIRKMIKKEKNKPKMKKLFDKIRKTVVILGITGGLSGAIYQYAIYDAKKKINEQTEEAIKNSKMQDSIATYQTKITITPEILKQHIRTEQLAPGISYESVSAAINSIKNDETRKQVIEYLKQGNITEAQEIFGMKRNSEYASNQATGMIDHNSLSRFGDPYFNLQSREILEHQNIPQDVKDIYQKFLLGTINNNDANYIIISKTDFELYLFTKDHRLLNRQISLLGKDIGKKGERIPYDGYRTDKGRIYHDKEVNTNTPEGLFRINDTYKLTDRFICDGPKIALVLIPIDNATQMTDSTKYDLMKYGFWIHSVYQPQKDISKYQRAIESEGIDDNAVTHGCPNITNFGIVKDNISLGKSIVFVTGDK